MCVSWLSLVRPVAVAADEAAGYTEIEEPHAEVTEDGERSMPEAAVDAADEAPAAAGESYVTF